MKNKLIIAILSSTILSGCIQVAATGAATTGALLARDKSFGTSFDDAAIKTKIMNDLFRTDIDNLFVNVSVHVSEGKVLVTGKVKSPEDRLEVARIVWQQKGVKEVINELVIDDTKKRFSLGEYSKDSMITTQVKARFFLNQRVHSFNYNVETIKGIVYILGIARSNEELQLVNNIAAKVRFVKKVVSYVRIKTPDENLDSNNNSSIFSNKNSSNEASDQTYSSDKIEKISTQEIQAAPVPVIKTNNAPASTSKIAEPFEGDTFDD